MWKDRGEIGAGNDCWSCWVVEVAGVDWCEGGGNGRGEEGWLEKKEVAWVDWKDEVETGAGMGGWVVIREEAVVEFSEEVEIGAGTDGSVDVCTYLKCLSNPSFLLIIKTVNKFMYKKI